MGPSDSSYVPKPRAVKQALKNELPSNTQGKKQNSVNHSSNSALKNITNDSPKCNVKCKLCRQKETENVDIPPNAVDECVALTHNVLANIYTDGGSIQHNLTNYSIFDENGHLCSIDSGVIERNINLYLTGFIKPINDNDPSIENGVAVSELGPILEWWVSYGGGDSFHVVIGVSTDYADYFLIEPHTNFKKYTTSVTEKIHLSNFVIESMLDSINEDPTYEDILDNISKCNNPVTNNKFTEEDLLSYADFVLDQVVEYDSNDTHTLPLAETQCMKTLTELSGVDKSITVPYKRVNNRAAKQPKYDRKFSKATTTELVKDVFESMFGNQLDSEKSEESVKQVFNDECLTKIEKEPSKTSYVHTKEVVWKDQMLRKKMFVSFKTNMSSSNLIGRIEFFFKTKSENRVHILLFTQGCHTVLGKASDCQEIFALKKCTSIDVKDIVKIVEVKHKVPSDDWFNLGNSKLQSLLEPVDRNRKNDSFFFQLQYDDEFGRFEYPKFINPCDDTKVKYCSVCEDNKIKKLSKSPRLNDFIEKDGKIRYYYKLSFEYNDYKVGNFIYLPPGTFSKAVRTNFINTKSFVHPTLNKKEYNNVIRKVDETLYPEYYRKTEQSHCKGSNEKTPDPFEIAEILAVYVYGKDIKNVKLVVRRMYRAEQIPLENNTDMNMLYWSDEEFRIFHTDIQGKCFVSYIENIQDSLRWSSEGPNRFYFSQKYDFVTGSLLQGHRLSNDAKLTGQEVFVNYNCEFVDENKVQNIIPHKKIKPLNGLDIFAGCGGLSKGFEDSGLAKTKWAVESDEMASEAFKLNNPESTVFVEDCNDLLKLAMSGSITDGNNQKIPKKGEVEFICGGPPCQGFSGMNRFNSGQYSLFKNSLIVSFLSYVDYYRPKFFVMENVRNFVSFKQSMVLKLTLRCITRMGYQCTFGILQAGNFGVPQTRRRLFIMAAAPGENLPFYPEPIHVFNKRSSSLNIQVGDKKFRTNCKYEESAPMRTVTVYDAWSDLPEVSNGANEEKIPYQLEPITHMQRMLRHPENSSSKAILTDHICKLMSPLVQARMELIPVGKGSDWRDLPNIELKLSDGTMTNKLVYGYDDLKNGKGPGGALRGVCPCASGGKCNHEDRQSNTIIPWCLPHTANRHNEWSGLYGRVVWNGFCSTTITNPEPMGKQGRVLHPEQNRVVSVRECARSQGFNDSFLFYGPIINKHRQIGNAVPPPLGKAIGHEIIKSIVK